MKLFGLVNIRLIWGEGSWEMEKFNFFRYESYPINHTLKVELLDLDSGIYHLAKMGKYECSSWS
jgi:hypothetical protein